jgi:hypothetical protein
MGTAEARRLRRHNAEPTGCRRCPMRRSVVKSPRRDRLRPRSTSWLAWGLWPLVVLGEGLVIGFLLANDGLSTRELIVGVAFGCLLGLRDRWRGGLRPSARQPHRLAVPGHRFQPHRRLLGQQVGMGGPCQPGPVVGLGAAPRAWDHGLPGDAVGVGALPGPAVPYWSAAVASLATSRLGHRAGARPVSDRASAHPGRSILVSATTPRTRSGLRRPRACCGSSRPLPASSPRPWCWRRWPRWWCGFVAPG